MTKTRFAPWLVFACIGTLVGCTSGDQGTAGNTELKVVIPTGSSQSGPAAFDIEVVEYTINCVGPDFDPTTDPDIDSGPILDQDVTISGALEVLDTADPGVTTQDFGPALGEVYVFQGFEDIPADHACTAQLRARDGDGEVICSATEGFTVGADDLTTVNVLMYCGIPFQAPVGMLDLNGDFSFNVANYCPDLFVLNCVDPDLEELLVVPGLGAFVYSGCQVRFRDGDSQCGGPLGTESGSPSACDPQTCVTTPTGLDCAPSGLIDPPVKTTVVCASDQPGFFCAIPGPLFGTPCTPIAGDLCFDLSGGLACAPGSLMNCGGATADPFCEFMGDTLGVIGDAPPAPLAVGPGGFLVGCTVADDDGDPLTPPAPLTPGATVTCTALTTDGDTDCDKTESVAVSCPGLTACQAFGGNTTCQAAAPSQICISSTCNDATCDGTVANCCDDVAINEGVDCSSENPPLASCQGGVCTTDACTIDPDCDDNDPCTVDTCDGGTGICANVPGNAGASCNAGSGPDTGQCDGISSSAGGGCVDNCTGVICDDGNPCTDDSCDPSGGVATCVNTDNDANACSTCPSGICLCSAGACVEGCTVPAPVNAPAIPMACRNSFNQAVSTFPIDLLNVTTDPAVTGGCILDGQPVDFDMDPVIALDTAFLAAAAATLCDLGTFLSEADVTSAQVSIDAIAGATCTEQLAVLPGTPVTVNIPSTLTCVGGSNDGGACTTANELTDCPGGACPPCGSGGVAEVTAGIALPLPPQTVPCTAGTSGSEVQLCSTGTVPLAISLTVPPPPPTYTNTYVGVSVGGGSIQVAFACNTSSTTDPLPGVSIGCILGNGTPSTPGGLDCAGAVATGDVGEQPFPISDCNTADGPPTPNQVCEIFGNPSACTGTCDTTPVGVNPSSVCATFTVQ